MFIFQMCRKIEGHQFLQTETQKTDSSEDVSGGAESER